MIRSILKAFAPIILASVVLSYSFTLSGKIDILPSSLSPDMPLGDDLPGWKGIKTQESEAERKILSADTKFSKAIYKLKPRVPWEPDYPAINVSLVFSGQDMNNSIHRPEVCLPAQGHLNLQGMSSDIKLSNGRTLTLTRLSSTTPVAGDPKKRLNYLHYYVFVGNGCITHSHLARNMQDTVDRFFHGQVQAWAYFQAGTCWGTEINVTEEDADRRLRKLISELLPGLINWESIK